MSTALFGLLGVIVGALSSGAVHWFSQRRLEKRGVRSAVRLLCSDLYTAQALIEPVRLLGVWGPEKTPFQSNAFDLYGKYLSEELDLSTWDLVEGSVLGIRRLDGIRASAEEEARAFDDAELADFERIGEWIDETLLDLERLKK